MKPSEVFVEFIKHRLTRSNLVSSTDAETVAQNLMCDLEFNEVVDRIIEDAAQEYLHS